jgi:hypothetical protein
MTMMLTTTTTTTLTMNHSNFPPLSTELPYPHSPYTAV